MSNPTKTDITYNEAESFLISKGFIKTPASGGSHVIFKKLGFPRIITLVTNTKHLKPQYVKQIKQAIEDLEDK